MKHFSSNPGRPAAGGPQPLAVASRTPAGRLLAQARGLVVFLLAAMPMLAHASHGTAAISDIDHSGMGTFSGSYTQSTTDHPWFVFNANAGNVITIGITTAFSGGSHAWLYRASDGCAEIGDRAGAGLLSLQSAGNGSNGYNLSYTVPTTGQFALQLDSFVGGSGAYTVTLGGSTAATVLCTFANPTLAVGSVALGPYCTGAGVSVPFTATGAYSAGNVFTAQLSDAAGSFAAPTTIGSVAGTASGTIGAVIPATAPASSDYHVRVVSSGPALVSNENAGHLTVNARPTAALSGSGSICAGASASLQVALTGPGPWSVTYTNGTAPVTVSATASPLLIAVSPASTTTYSLTAVSNTQCSGTATGTATVSVTTLAATLAPTHVGCYGARNGAIASAVTGGTPATYAWTGPNGFAAATPDIANLGPGTYTLTVSTASGCAATASTTLTEPLNLTPVATADQLSAVACTPLIISASTLLANDTDPQNAALQVADVLAPSSGTLVNNNNGTYTYTPAAGFTGTATFQYVIKKNDALVAYSGNNHLYEYVSANNICWGDARTAAAARTYQGMRGYLATITSAGENAFAAAKLQGNGWLGASDEDVEGQWRWKTGPEAGQQFWQGLYYGSATNGSYSNWAGGEPNDAGNEDYAHFYGGSGTWNDFPNCRYGEIQGYVVEYGGLEGCIPVLTATATATVTVAPAPATVITQDITVALDANGTASITAAQVNNGSTAACAITGLSVSPSTFSCANLGPNPVTLTVTTQDGTSTSAPATVTVVDNTLPTIAAPAALTLSTDAGQCTASNVALGQATAADNCAATVTNDAPAAFAKGTTTVTWTATDAAGNVATATQLVTVNDTERPVLAALANLIVDAPATLCGAVVAFNATATDNCGATVVASPASGSTFAVGTTTVAVTATDAAGNSSTSSFTVTVRDVTAPTALARNVSVALANGAASVTAAQVNNGSADACGIASVSLNKTAFTCANIGANPVTLTVTDVHGNVSTASAVVTVTGTVPAPGIAVATPAGSAYTGGVATTLYLGYGAQSATLTATGGVSYTWSPATGLTNYKTASPTFTASAAGTYAYTVTATSASGCTATKTVTLRVVDVRCGNNNDKVTVCHNGHDICISPNAVDTHLSGHAGDQLGSCGPAARPAAEAPAAAALAAANELSAFPNPLTDNATVTFRTAASGPAQVLVYNELGQRVAVLFDGPATAGQPYSLTLQGHALASGLYVCRLVANGKTQSLRLTVVR